MSDIKGQIFANWYVFCNLCNEHGQHSRPRVYSLREAAKHFRALGWKQGGLVHPKQGTAYRLWLCPECAQNTGNFLQRCKKLPSVKVEGMPVILQEAYAKKKLNRKLYT